MNLLRPLNDVLLRGLWLERRIEPYFRPAFDRLLQKPLTSLVQRAINARRRDPPLGLAEERRLPNEDEITALIVETMATFLHRQYDGAPPALRAGNTKTYGVVRAEFEVLSGLPSGLRHGLFAVPRTYPAWVRCGGPGPLAPPDLRDNGVLSLGVKVMGVDGPKLLDDEKGTQDFTGISAPTFTTPDIVENLKLQGWSLEGMPLFYFIGLRAPHVLDGMMQGLYAKTHTNPLEARYWSCVAYLLGEGQAMHYSITPRARGRTRFPRRPSANYLREAMVATLAGHGVEYDFGIQLQTDPWRMPVETAAVAWPEDLSPFVTVAKLRVPAQRFDSPAQLAFGENLAFNPWHSVPEHRPLGNQNRARRTIYYELSKLRQAMNGSPHVEPTGNEVFA